MAPAHPILTVRAGGEVLLLPVGAGESVREVLDATHLRVRAACGGTGSCGACVVRVVSGQVTAPTVADNTKLTPSERADGRRLACQLRLKGDAEVHLEHVAPPSPWRSVAAADLSPLPPTSPGLEGPPLGVAVDLGTTHIRVSLVDRRSGRRIATRLGPNPQGAFGADVLNRLERARGLEAGRELARLARTAILEALGDMLARDLGAPSELQAVGRVLVVGNTAMLALLTGQGGEALLDPENWERSIDCQPKEPEGWLAEWRLPHAEVLLGPPVGGFIGSDLCADLLATRLAESPGAALLLDLGTNTEMALWDGERLRVTSVPGGPAFEGGVSRGMPAERGAIYRVTSLDSDAGRFTCEVLGGGAPRGICGSGLVDAIALLLRQGRLKPTGRFVVSPGAEGLQLCPPDAHTAIFGRDVDAMQRAKAATAAAAEVLLQHARLGWGDLSRVCVCGAFGRTLDLAHAMELGLLPSIAPARIELEGGAALAGCEQALLSSSPLGALSRAAPRPITVNMSLVEAYGDRFIDHLRLRPIPRG